MTRRLQAFLKLGSLSLIIALLCTTTWAQPPAGRKGRRPRKPDHLKVGDIAPGFTLKSPDGKTKVTLGKYKGKKPVALVFGSYT